MTANAGRSETEVLTFHIMGDAARDVSAAFQKFLAGLASRSGMRVESLNASEARLVGARGQQGQLTLLSCDVPSSAEEEAAAFNMSLVLPRSAAELFQRMRTYLLQTKAAWRIFSDSRNCLVPLDANLYLLDFPMEERVRALLQKLGLEAVYYYHPTSTFFASADDESVRIVNTGLLDFVLHHPETTARDLGELSYAVAPNIQAFGVLYSRGLVPVNFYEYFRRPRKIFNYSFLDLLKPERPILLRPQVFELHALHAAALKLDGEREDARCVSALRSGESLDDALRRILKDELGVADDYVGAYVSRLVEFDRDSNGEIRPCLTVSIFLERIANRERAERDAGASADRPHRRRRRRHKRKESAARSI